MAGRSGKRARKIPIEQLAMKSLTARHVATRTEAWSIMKRAHGKKAAQAAVDAMVEMLTICDPSFVIPAQR